jgi:hypothetical protein
VQGSQAVALASVVVTMADASGGVSAGGAVK